jgi:hypothetical protein
MLVMGMMSSCKHEQHPIDVIPPIDTTHNPPTNTHIIDFGKLSFEKNGELKNPPTYSIVQYYKDHARFDIDTYWSNAYPGGTDHFAIGDIPCAKGIYPILNIHIGLKSHLTPESTYIVVVNGDEPAAYFAVDTSRSYENNFIEVLGYNPQDSTVEGRFQVTMFIDPKQGPPSVQIPDSIAIKNGKFYTKIQRF